MIYIYQSKGHGLKQMPGYPFPLLFWEGPEWIDEPVSKSTQEVQTAQNSHSLVAVEVLNWWSPQIVVQFVIHVLRLVYILTVCTFHSTLCSYRVTTAWLTCLSLKAPLGQKPLLFCSITIFYSVELEQCMPGTQ